MYEIGAKLGLYIKLYTSKSNKFNTIIDRIKKSKSLKNKKNILRNKINKTKKRIKRLLDY